MCDPKGTGKGTWSEFKESDETGNPVYVNINTLLIMS